MHFPMTLGVRRSRFLDTAILWVVLLVSGVILIFPRSTAVLAAILLLAWGMAVFAWWQLQPKIAALRLQRDGNLEILYPGSDGFVPAHCLPGATVHPWLTVLRIELSQRQRLTLLVTHDTMDAEDFRRLRVFLRWRADFNALPVSGL